MRPQGLQRLFGCYSFFWRVGLFTVLLTVAILSGFCAYHVHELRLIFSSTIEDTLIFQQRSALTLTGFAAVVLGVLLLLIAQLLFLVFAYQCWKLIQDGQARTGPIKAMVLLFVPLFNLYWVFIAIGSLSRGLNEYAERRGIPGRPASTALAVAYCILVISCFTPFIVLDILPLLLVQYLLLRSWKNAAVEIAMAKVFGPVERQPLAWRGALATVAACVVVACCWAASAHWFWPLHPDIILRLDQGYGQHGYRVDRVIFSPDGRYLATVDDRQLQVWDIGELRSGDFTRPYRVFQMRGTVGWVLTFSADGKRIIAGDSERGYWTDSVLRSWDVDSGRELPWVPLGFKVHGPSSLSADGRYLAVGITESDAKDATSTIEVFDAGSGQSTKA
jgi:hypothetical protein